MRGQFNSDELSVLFFTGMTVGELIDYKLDMAKRWLVRYCVEVYGFSEQTANQLSLEPELLRWWNLHWKRFDHYYILPMLHKVVEAERENVYRAMHEEIFDGQHPSYELMKISLNKMLAGNNNSTSEI